VSRGPKKPRTAPHGAAYAIFVKRQHLFATFNFFTGVTIKLFHSILFLFRRFFHDDEQQEWGRSSSSLFVVMKPLM
jgi:hypothetical protein